MIDCWGFVVKGCGVTEDMAGGGAPAPKQDELVPHPVKDQLPNIAFYITSPPPWPEAIILGFQHYLVMLGTTVLIPTALLSQMGGNNEDKAKVIQTLLFVAGLNTLAQTLFGTWLPAVIGGSLTFVPATISIIQAARYNDIVEPHEKFLRTMRGIQGSLLIASILQILLGFSGLWRNVARFLSPLSAVPLVSLVGFGLYEHGFPGVAKCVEVGLPELIILNNLSQLDLQSFLIISISELSLRNINAMSNVSSQIFSRFAVIVSVIIVWLYAFLLTVSGAYKNSPNETQVSCRTDRSGLVGVAPWISVPYPFQWGRPTVDAGECFTMMAASFVALVESTGTYMVVSRYASVTPVPPSVLSRGIGWQGIAILMSGMFGTVAGSTVSVENAGLLALTRIGSRRVVQISAGFMIFFSILGKFGAVFASIPAPIVAALYCLFFAYVGSAGLSILQFCNLNTASEQSSYWAFPFSWDYQCHSTSKSTPQAKLMVQCILMQDGEGLSFNSIICVLNGAVNRRLTSILFNDMINVPLSSEAFVAGVVAYFLDVTLHKNDSETRRDRGMHWWDKFRYFGRDTRSEEFYRLPFNLNKFFPSM
ncbi:hypothetical protein GIB67_003390 [Kingdonia uniflora]|uniref:Uncharacterized protein n=1 Tax=Kingdonia uniflora TaxID=39325 RepID=A0A7J7P9D1_9MAGN|nr:hypothetical protein GIB67_003390 [Kingdonia uniflora]